MSGDSVDAAMQALEELRSQMDLLVDTVKEKMQRLHSALDAAQAPGQPKARVVSAEEPAALVDYSNAQSEEQAVMIEQTMERRFVGNLAVKRGEEIRLHGRWMELSARAGDDDAVLKSLVFRQTGHRVSDKTQRIQKNSALHPGGSVRVFWDVIGIILLCGDGMLMPVSLAWDLHMDEANTFSLLLTLFFWIGLIYWSLDILVNFNTAIYVQGGLETSRNAIALKYLRSWLVFDAALVILDLVNATGEMAGDLGTLRSLRVVRALRLLRLLKVSKLKTIIEDMVASTGRQSIVFLLAIVNTGVLIVFLCHLLTCLWYGIGRASAEEGQISWIDISQAQDVPGWHQYLHSLRYVINAPSPPLVAPDNSRELVFDICTNVLCLIVLGSAVSKISQALADMRATNEEHDRQRREVRLYLTNQNAPFELVTRIMKFVDYRLDKMTLASFDGTLISNSLRAELFVNQRSDYLVQLPIFSLAQAVYPDVFADICALLQKQVFEKKQPVFVVGSWAKGMHVTISGTFSYADPDSISEQVQGISWFEEASLYTDGLLHQSSLISKTFAETFILAGSDLVQCVQNTPGCTRMFLEYARDFVANLQKNGDPFSRSTQVQAGESACISSLHYQELYPDPRKMFDNILVGEALAGSVAASESEAEDAEATRRISESQLSGNKESWLLRRQDSALMAVNSKASMRSEKESQDAQEFGLAGLAEDAMQGNLTEDDDALCKRLRTSLPELHEEYGPHAIFEQATERARAESACISVLALVSNRFETFTQQQPDDERLQNGQWGQLQDIVTWIAPSAEQVHGVLVLLAIRGLCKSKVAIRQIPKPSRRPERAILYLMDCARNVVPSVQFVSESAMDFVRSALVTHEAFNLAQMLQAENVPGSVVKLQHHIQQRGEEDLRFYLLFLLGFMSGLSGGQGSTWMNAKNAEGTLAGIQMLQQLMTSTPRGIYWGFLSARADALAIPRETTEDLALLRLSVLARLQSAEGYAQLRASWDAVGTREKTVLTQHLLADGIEERAFILEFLPALVSNAHRNRVIGLTLLLEVLVSLLSNLQPALAHMALDSDRKMVRVDLSDMAEFVAAVQNRFVFQTCMVRSRLRFFGDRLQLEMTGGNWARCGEPDNDTTALAHALKEIFERQRDLEMRVSSPDVPKRHLDKVQSVSC